MDTTVQYQTLSEFVEGVLIPNYGPTVARNAKENWLAKWWRYPELFDRFEGLWLRYELLWRDEPATLFETFFRQYGDYHMQHLMNEMNKREPLSIDDELYAMQHATETLQQYPRRRRKRDK